MAKSAASDLPAAPSFVESYKMLKKMAELEREISAKAFEFFELRTRGLDPKLDDWLKAESEFLQPATVEITETNNVVNVRVSIRGFKLQDIEVSINNDGLFLSGETRFEMKGEAEKIFYSEWRSNRFCRKLQLPTEVIAEGVETNLHDGILTLTLKKKPIAEEA